MKSINDLLLELESLPKGYISKKTIHGKEYFYLQFLENKKIVSKYVKTSDLKELKTMLAKRKEIEEELDTLLKQEKRLDSCAPTTLELTGYVMSNDTVVAEFEKGQLVRMDEKLAPLIIVRTHDLLSFLNSRVLDTSRTNAKLLKRLLNLRAEEDYMIALKNHATSVTDDYWFRSKNSRLKYKDVCLASDIYNEISLKGELLYFPKNPSSSPQFSLRGSYEKCWRLVDDEWWMYKVGTKEEKFSEYISATLSNKLGIVSAEYVIEEPFIKTRNFVEEKYNFEPMNALCGDNDSYENVFSILIKQSKKLAKQYLMLMWFDALVNNVDRHNENLGLLRDKKTGEVISLAPDYDLNMSLFARNKLLKLEKDGFINMFLKFANNSDAKELYKEMTCPNLNEDIIDDIVLNLDLREYSFDLKAYLLYRFNVLKVIFD